MNNLLTSGRLWRMCLKELRETLRDRRTVTTLLLMPILVYPLLSITLQRIILTSAPSGPERPIILGVASDDEVNALLSVIKTGQAILQEEPYQPIRINRPASQEEKEDAISKTIVMGADSATVHFDVRSLKGDFDSSLLAGEADPVFEADGDKLLDKSLRNAEVDVTAKVRLIPQAPNTKSLGWVPYRVQVHYISGDNRSEQAVQQLRRLMQAINDVEDARLRRSSKASESAAVEMIADPTSIRSDESNSLATIIPLVLVLMTITGAVYPAIDLTAGERERGTMEALVASPVPRFALLISKYVAVVTVAVLTAVANLSAMWITLSSSGLGTALLGKQGFSLYAVAQILPLLVIFAGFFSAILLALCSFAKSFKEAQAYLIPVMLISLAPGLVSLMPGITFTPMMAIVPLVNIVLLARDIMTGNASAISAFVAVAVTILYAGAVLSIAARLFGTDASMQGGQATWSDLFRRPKVAQSFPSLDQLAIYLACFYPVFFIVTSTVGNMEKVSFADRLWINAVILCVGFLIIPWLFSRFRNIDITSTFRLTKGRGWTVLTLISVAMLSVSSWMVGWELFVLAKWAHLVTLREDQIKAVQSITSQFQELPLWIILTTMAIAPAICEEFFFRGFALSAMHRLSRSRAVVFSALLFGLFHVITGSVLSPERFLPTAFLGLVAGLVAVRSEALWPGIFLHAVYNGTLFTLAYFEKELAAEGWGVQEQVNLPISWLATGAIVFVIGLAVFWVNTSNAKSQFAETNE